MVDHRVSEALDRLHSVTDWKPSGTPTLVTSGVSDGKREEKEALSIVTRCKFLKVELYKPSPDTVATEVSFGMSIA